jgi:hypothetical protein
MAKYTLYTWIGLIILTVVTGLVSMSAMKYSAVLILLLAALKFIMVAFEFMEIKAAHIFWKVALLAFLLIFVGLVILFL